MTTPSDADRAIAAQACQGCTHTNHIADDGHSHMFSACDSCIEFAITQARAEGEQRLREYEHEVMTGRSEQHDQLVARVEKGEQEAARLADALEVVEAKLAGLEVCPDDSAPWRHYKACHDPKDWPADLLEAVSVAWSMLICGCEDNSDCRHTRAIATLIRYRLIADPSEGGKG